MPVMGLWFPAFDDPNSLLLLHHYVGTYIYLALRRPRYGITRYAVQRNFRRLPLAPSRNGSISRPSYAVQHASNTD